MNNNEQNKIDPRLGAILQLLRDIPILDVAPVDTPRTLISFALYDSGGVRRFYIFFNGNWSYITLT